MSWNYATGLVTAHLSVSGRDGESGMLTIAWPSKQVHAQVTISGELGGRTIAALMYAP
jgi:hypothetical protein